LGHKFLNLITALPFLSIIQASKISPLYYAMTTSGIQHTIFQTLLGLVHNTNTHILLHVWNSSVKVLLK